MQNLILPFKRTIHFYSEKTFERNYAAITLLEHQTTRITIITFARKWLETLLTG